MSLLRLERGGIVVGAMKDYASIVRVADRLVAWKMMDRASALLERYLERFPGNPEMLRRLGRIRLAQGRVSEAVPLLEQAVAHDRMMAPMRAGEVEAPSMENRRRSGSAPRRNAP